MYTQCPECETTFKLGADDLRRAKGKVRCGECDAVFNALEYLAEQASEAASENPGNWTDSAANPVGDLKPDLEAYEEAAFTESALDDDSLEDDAFDDDALEDDDTDNGPVIYIDDGEDNTDDEALAEDSDSWDAGGTEEDLQFDADEDVDDEVWDEIPGVGDPEDWQPENETAKDSGENNLEFDVPQGNWSNFFGPLPKGQSTATWAPPALGEDDGSEDEFTDEDEVEPPDNEAAEPEDVPFAESAVAADPSSELESAPDWRDSEEPESRRSLVIAGTLALAAALTVQLIHYNRDSIASSPEYGARLRQVYAVLGSELYPNWNLDHYEIRGSEAIAGETGQDILDIRAQIANTGAHATGLPRLRVVLRDRWSNPVAAQDFGPDQYVRDDALPEDGLLQPGTVINSHVSIQDPGSGAQGFELELCLPRRDSGLECTDQPFK
jgi:predicted Zn finger-like uncharacterized protein